MVFSSSLFLTQFLPIFLLIYHFVDQRYKNWTILLASLLFYSWGAPQFVFILTGSTIIDFFIVQKLHRTQDDSSRKRLLTISICINVGLLLYFKYANFFVDNVNAALTNWGWTSLDWVPVALPIGISFYTFQTLTYSIDVYRKVSQPLDKLSDYLLYILSFPQMIAGPIIRFNSIAKEILHRTESLDDRLQGFIRFSIGLAKKVLIANVLGEQADALIDQEQTLWTSTSAWLGILAYTFQIYFDFSGYSDMAIGLGRMMGFSFPENFNHPYTSTSITEFWRRWHITLGTWMKDYLYIPLGGNRVKSKVRLFFNLWLVFLISGLWHGAAWNFVLWGAYHGLFLILDRLFLIRVLDQMGKIPALLITFLIVVIGWVFFRIEDMSVALSFLELMFSFHFDFSEMGLTNHFKLVFGVAVLFSFCRLFKWGAFLENYFLNNQQPSIQWYSGMIALSAVLYVLSLSAITGTGFNPFIYFRF